MPTMEDNSIDLVVTDPPYEFVSKKVTGGGFMIPEYKAHLHKISDTFGMTYDPAWYLAECKRVLKKFNGYFWTNKTLLKDYINFAEDNKYKWDILNWIKPNAIPINNGHYLIDKEYLVYIKEGGATFNSDLGYQTYFTAKSFPIGSKRTAHPTEKPLQMHLDIIRVSSNEGDTIFDGYSGSGTTPFACSLTKRNYVCVEQDLHWVDYSRNLIKIPTIKRRSNFKETESTNQLFEL